MAEERWSSIFRDPVADGPHPPFRSILGVPAAAAELPDGALPPYFADLHLDQVLASLVTGREEYALEPFFCTPARDLATIRYRHEVMRDLQDPVVIGAVRSFAERMREMRAQLAQAAQLRSLHQRGAWFLDAVETYCGAVKGLARGLAIDEVRSPGMQGLRMYLGSYLASSDFCAVDTDVSRLRDALSTVRYCVHVKGGRVRVARYEGEADYSAEVHDIFARFEQEVVKDYRVGFPDRPEANRVESDILDRVARLFGEVFSELQAFADRHRTYLDPTIGRFDREVQFYVAYREYTERIGATGLDFCYPEVGPVTEILARDTYDLALADKLSKGGGPVVCNDFHLEEPERTFVVSGPNQGGKTTFARTFGQLHHLAAIGCPVPGTTARLFHFDRLFTHFEKEESITDLRGKLEDDLVRIHDVLAAATADSIIILNEVFTSTTLQDAQYLGKRVLEQIVQLGARCVYVTFVEELASLDRSVVSMVSTVVPDNPTERTFRVVRKDADGQAYAMAIAKKYGLTYDQLQERIGA